MSTQERRTRSTRYATRRSACASSTRKGGSTFSHWPRTPARQWIRSSASMRATCRCRKTCGRICRALVMKVLSCVRIFVEARCDDEAVAPKLHGYCRHGAMFRAALCVAATSKDSLYRQLASRTTSTTGSAGLGSTLQPRPKWLLPLF